MKRDDGYNPLRWDCETQGCFYKKMSPKLEVFCDCFPGRINFGNVDGIVEINGKALLIEWKHGHHHLPIGQRVMYERLSASGLITVFCLSGNPETMAITGISMFRNGKQSGWQHTDLGNVKRIIKTWVDSTRQYS